MITLQDISCMGKCSLTVALPIISAMGTECCVIPTALLSAHTAFSGFTFHDLTDEIPLIADHFKEMGADFSAIYTGYLGSERQLEIVSDFIDSFGRDAFVFVDPVMGDFGRLYSGFDAGFAGKMAGLCAKADVIVPNLTEAAFLLGEPCRGRVNEAEGREMLKRLCGLGAKNAVLTGIEPGGDMMGIMAYSAEKNEFFSHYSKKLPATLHGTGDVFASCAVGGISRGMSLEDAFALAVDFTARCVAITSENPDARWYGVDFEDAIPWLCNRIRK